MSKLDDLKQEYVPFGDEWRKEMMQVTKAGLIDFLKRVCEKNIESTSKLEEKDAIIDKLKKENHASVGLLAK